jgi:hypothetical protein
MGIVETGRKWWAVSRQVGKDGHCRDREERNLVVEITRKGLYCKDREESIDILGTGRNGFALWRQRGKGWTSRDRVERWGIYFRTRRKSWHSETGRTGWAIQDREERNGIAETGMKGIVS